MIVVRRHPVITFWVLAFGLTWIVWAPRALGQDWAVTAGAAWTWMPAVAAVITAALADGLGEETGWRGFALPRMLQPSMTCSP